MSEPKHILVVGGSRGIGRAVALAFLRGGHTVSVLARRSPAAEDAEMARAEFYGVDVQDHDAITRVVAKIAQHSGPISHTVFLQRFRGEGDAWSKELDISLNATRLFIDALLPHLVDAGDRSFVLVSSMAGRFIASEQPLVYHVTKAGLEQMARYYAVTLGPKGIRVNAVALGAVLKQEARTFYAEHPELTQLYSDITPLGRMGTAEEIASAIQFLCSPGASFITGHTLVVDGGLSLLWQEALARKVSPLRDLQVTRPSEKQP